MQDVFPVGAPAENYVETSETTNVQSTKKWSSILGLSSLVLKNVGRYFLSIPSSDWPPYPTVFTSATVIALNHHVLWLCWPWVLPLCLGSFSGQKLCSTCLSVPKPAQSPSMLSSQELCVKLYLSYYLRKPKCSLDDQAVKGYFHFWVQGGSSKMEHLEKSSDPLFVSVVWG